MSRDEGKRNTSGVELTCNRQESAHTGASTKITPPGKNPKAVDSPYASIDLALKRFNYSQGELIKVLRSVQETFGFLDDDMMAYIAQELKLLPTCVYAVAAFYHCFNLKPKAHGKL